jgi:NADH-quinone oxidoreductase subunit N
MNQTLVTLQLMRPEMVLLVSALFIMMFDAFGSDKRRWIIHALSLIALLACAWTVGGDVYAPAVRSEGGLFVRDTLSDVLKLFMTLTTAIVLVYGRHYLEMKRQYSGTFYLLILFALLGMFVLVSAGNLLTIYLGLELMALATYALVALDRDNGIATESAMKYFVLGALASGILLYGMSLLFGLTGSLDLLQINQVLSSAGTSLDSHAPQPIIMAFALACIVIGLAFKFGAVPFHMWLPDVYEGSPTAMTAFIASVPKLAAVGMAIRLLPEGLHALQPRWQEMLALLAMASLIIGNLAALAQYNLKRMLAYSTISHVGFMFLGLLAGNAFGYSAMLFYALVYALTTAAAFGVIASMARDGVEFDRIDDFKGLNQRSPGLALVMLIVMASMAGLPPLVGFWAKLQAIMSVVAMGAGMKWLVFVAALSAVIGAYYYLNVIKAIYFDKASTDAKPIAPIDVRIVLFANALVLVVLGFYWQPLIAVCRSVFAHMA